MEQLRESIEFFDKYVNESLAKDVKGFTPIEVVKHYNIIRAELAKVLADKE